MQRRKSSELISSEERVTEKGKGSQKEGEVKSFRCLSSPCKHRKFRATLPSVLSQLHKGSKGGDFEVFHLFSTCSTSFYIRGALILFPNLLLPSPPLPFPGSTSLGPNRTPRLPTRQENLHSPSKQTCVCSSLSAVSLPSPSLSLVAVGVQDHHSLILPTLYYLANHSRKLSQTVNSFLRSPPRTRLTPCNPLLLHFLLFSFSTSQHHRSIFLSTLPTRLVTHQSLQGKS